MAEWRGKELLGGKTDGRCGLEVLAWTYCICGSCQTVPLRLTEVEMKGEATPSTFVRVLISWMLGWNSDSGTYGVVSLVLPGGCAVVACRNSQAQVIWGIECTMCSGFSTSPRSPISSEYDAAVDINCLEDRSVSAPRDFCVVHSLKHPREENSGHPAKQTYQSIHPHIPPEPTLSSFPISALWLFSSA